MHTSPDLLIRHASQMVTLEPGSDGLGIIEDGALAVSDGEIAWLGATESLPAHLAPGPSTRVLDARGQVLTPGLVDCHTHLVFAGDRAADFEARARGATYAEIAARGGGIATTVDATRRASLEELCAAALPRLDRMLAYGVTTAEVKSGYGLDLESELKILRAIAALGDLHPIDLVPTFLGAHTVPREYAGRRADYLELLADEVLPAVSEERLATFCDIYVEPQVAFSPDDARRLLPLAREHGLFPKLHVDQLAPGAGAELAAELGAVSADHLEHVSAAGIEALAREGVVAVLLPCASLFLGARAHAPARRLLDAGVEVALATDCNPGTAPTEALPLAGTIACAAMGMTPAEALRAMTLTAAKAVGLEGRIGSLRPGKLADLVLFDGDDYRHLFYEFGAPRAAYVFKGGEEVFGEEGGEG